MGISSLFRKGQSARQSVISTRRSSAVIENLEDRTLMSTYYVATGGSNDASGSIKAPLKTIQYAINKAKDGDTINVRGGDYRLSSGLRITKGLTIQGYGSEKVRIIAPTSDANIENAVNTGEADNVRLRKLDISGGYYYAIKSEGGDRLLIDRCRVHDSGRDVIKLTPGTDRSIIQNTRIYNSGRRDPSNAEGIDAVNANDAILRDSTIYDTTTNGVYYKGGSRNTIIERNRITRTGHSAILLGQSTDPEFFSDNNPNHYESINGIVRNNVVWNVEGAGVGAWGALNARIYNNTLYNVAKTYFGGLLVQSENDLASRNVSLRNNIVVVGGNRPILNIREGGLTGDFDSNYNLFSRINGSGSTVVDEVHGYNGGIAGWKAMGFDTRTLTGNPKLDAGRGYRLSSSSSAINRGITLSAVTNDLDKQSRPLSGRTDIGADERA
jgi:hypothetical protein